MSFYKTLKVDFEFEDYRGHLTQLVHDGFEQVNVLFSKQNSKRGNHYHKISREAFYIIDGSVNVTFEKNGETEKIEFNKGDFFLIEPFVNHSMFFPSDCLMVQMYDVPIEKEDGTKDIYDVD